MSATPTQEQFVQVFRTPVGFVAIVGTEGDSGRRLSHVHIGSSSSRELLHATRELPRPIQESAWWPELAEQLTALLSGEEVCLRDIPCELSGLSQFQQRALLCAQQLPWGTTVSYADLAVQLGHPGAARAVGTAMSRNQCLLVIPCHRVISSSGGLGGYSGTGGVTLKQHLLELEGSRLPAAGHRPAVQKTRSAPVAVQRQRSTTAAVGKTKK